MKLKDKLAEPPPKKNSQILQKPFRKKKNAQKK